MTDEEHDRLSKYKCIIVEDKPNEEYILIMQKNNGRKCFKYMIKEYFLELNHEQRSMQRYVKGQSENCDKCNKLYSIKIIERHKIICKRNKIFFALDI